MTRSFLFAIVVMGLLGCDKAKGDFEKCVQLEASDPKSALEACRQARKADPNSKSGQAATEKVAQLIPKVIQLEQVKDADERAKRVTPEQKAAQQVALNQRMQELRAKIHRDRTLAYDDDHCAGEGKPGHSYRYGGGTYSENESLAYSEGCVPYDKDSVAVAGNAQNHFCCP